MRQQKAAILVTLLLLSIAGTAQNTAASIPRGTPFPRTCADIKKVSIGMSDFSVVSPDGKRIVCVKEDREDKDQLYTYTSVYLSDKSRMLTLGRFKDMTETGDLRWAPDSRAFAWNFTYGGACCGWTTWVFDFRSGHFVAIERMATRDYHRRLRQACKKDDADDNVYLMKWVDKSSLLLVVEAHPISGDCRRPSPTDFYQVALPSGRIIKRLQGTERAAVEKEWNDR
jgi:hypothetical protein